MEPRTLEELYRRYAGELYLYAYSLCQNEAQAQDLTAEAFCRALLALDGADAGWRSWLYKVCRNLWLDQVRRSRRLAPEPPGPELAAEGDVLEELLQEERRRAVYRAVQALSPVDREIVTLHYYGGLSLKEAGEAMGLSLIHISEPTRQAEISYAVFCLKKFFFNDTATTEIYTLHIVGSVRCV